MKKKCIPIFLFTLIGVMIYISCFLNEKDRQYQRFMECGEGEVSLNIVFSTELDDDIAIYQSVSTALDKANGNLYCLVVDNTPRRPTYTKYIYVTDPELFDDLPISRGRFFETDEMESDFYLTNVKNSDNKCIGVIDGFDKNSIFTLRTLNYFVEGQNSVFDRSFTLVVKDWNKYQYFQSLLKDDGIVVTIGNDDSNSGTLMFPYMIAAVLGMCIVLMLILFYDLIKQYKQIGIEKMLGYDTFGIWSSRIIPIVISELILYAVTTIVLSVILLCGFNFLIFKFLSKLAAYYLGILLLSLGLMSVPFIYVKKIPVYAMVKNRKPLKALIYFNMLVKVAIISLLLVVICLAHEQFNWLTVHKNNKYNNWEKMKQYVYIDDECHTDKYFDDFSDENMRKWKSIYKQFNQNGSILADFSNYSPLYKEDQFNAEFPQYYDVMVNPNYLRSFEIVDVSGHVIDISEEEKDYIILVPLKYQNVEEEIMEYYKDICEDETDNETVRIIWIPNGQKFFSCALDVGIDDDNSIIDPVVVVLTENNGYIGEYTRVAGYTGVPFKIKVSNIADAQSEISNVMSRYFDSEKTWFYVTSVYDAVKTQVQMANDKLFFYSVLIIVLVIIIIAAVIQGIITFVRQYRRVLAIKKLLGYRMIDMYQGYFMGVVVCYIISEAVAFIINKNRNVVIYGVMMFIFEFVCSLVYIKIKDRKNIVQITKGDS